MTAGCRLAVYGTLRPGERNHHEVAMCAGIWTPGFVRGWITVREHPFLVPAAAAPPVAVMVLTSPLLAAHWRRLDAFEGDEYVRVLVPVVAADDRLLTVANLYAARAADYRP